MGKNPGAKIGSTINIAKPSVQADSASGHNAVLISNLWLNGWSMDSAIPAPTPAEDACIVEVDDLEPDVVEVEAGRLSHLLGCPSQMDRKSRLGRVASRPSGSVNLYGLLFAYQYRLKFPPLTELAVTGSTLRNRPTP